ncbi:tRNA pseudouridine(13) synthase TruD [Micromonospora sp. NPDC047074]|uniref:tRNA pseudouridine(13) synthase TruD n=1 Tax=Micromonospora sp. NPDC047074 TaxID=3154339 RepID=UPI0033C865E3
MVGDQPVLKFVPEDFVVRENMVVELTPAERAEQHYLLMRKCGFTTMEAVRLVAAELGLPSTEVTYGGLKDEDGHTEQLVAVPAGTLPLETAAQGWWVAQEAGRWLELRHYGYGNAPLEVGKLEGNGFRILVRNLDHETAARLGARGKVTALYLNYYDTQRFGVPNGPKRTHHVGAAILDRRWDDALRELAGLGAPESSGAGAWTGAPEAYFTRLDPRTTSFYLAAFASDRWNRELSALVEQACPGEHFPVVVDGITYRYVTSPQAAARVLVQATMLPYDRYSFVDGAPVVRQSQRTTVVQTTISVDAPCDDHRFAGRSSLGLRFFLPSGSYATAAVRQVMAYA